MNRILSNIKYSIKNKSNYDITYEETKDIIDIPYYPAQNLVDLTKKLSIYNEIPELSDYIPFIHEYTDNNNNTIKEYVIYGLVNRNDSRILFIEYRQNKRKIVYKFKGIHYPQGRENYGLSFNGYDKLVLFGGYANGRCLNDLWLYDFNENKWTLLNYSEIEKSVNEIPSQRHKTSIMLYGDEIYIFGGETDTLIGNTFIPLNDLWMYKISTGNFYRLDRNGELPRRLGNIIYVDDNEIHIYVKGGYDDITGLSVPERIYIFDKGLNKIKNIIDITNPQFLPDYRHRTFIVNGEYYIKTYDNKLYKYDKTNNTFNLINSGSNEYIGITGDGIYYIEKSINEVHSGNDNRLPIVDLLEFKLIKTIDNTTVDYEFSITPPPIMYLPHYVIVDNRYIVFTHGMLTENTLNEKVFIYDSETGNTEVLTFNVGEYPSERLYPALCYDSKRNCIWLFGGYDGSSYKNDLWKFDLNNKVWIKIHDQLINDNPENPDYPEPRWKSSITVVDDYLYITGGYSDTQSFSDLWKYHIPTDTYLREYLIDNIPFGSQYYIFEYKDRLWLFNGDISGIYRYFYSKKQFIKQALKYHNISDKLEDIINKKEFIPSPIDISKVGNRIYIYNDNIGLILINLENFEIIDINQLYNFKDRTIFYNEIEGIVFYKDNNGKYYISTVYVNYSPLYPLTYNQIPSSYFYYDMNLNIRGHFGESVDEFGMMERIYIDGSGKFIIENELDITDKDELYNKGYFSFAGLQSEYPDLNLDDRNTIIDLTNQKYNDYTIYTFSPRFLYNIYSGYRSIFKGAINVFKREKDGSNKIYIVYENGNIVRYNTRDETFFTYFTKIWNFSAIGYDKQNDILYVFGGIVYINNKGEVDTKVSRQPYLQNGMAYIPIKIQCSQMGQTYKYVISHNGFMMVDFQLNEFSTTGILNYVKKYNLSVIDYDKVKDYLMEYINDYINAYGRSPSVYDIERMKTSLYLNTQSIIDDLSQITVMYENGERPYGRAMPIYVSTDKGLYIFGGCEIVYTDDCMFCETIYPIGECMKIGEVSIGDSNIVEDITKSAYYFDYETKRWRRLSNLPHWLYFGSAILTPDKSKIIIVGGATDKNLQNPSNKIYIYDIQNDTYEELKGIPDTYEGRLRPALYWIDDTKLLIMYGVKAKIRNGKCMGSGNAKEYVFIPVRDAWIVDFENDVMYKAFDDYDTAYGITVEDRSYDIDSELRKLYILNPYPIVFEGELPTIKLYEYDLKRGNVKYYKILPDTEIFNDVTILSIKENDEDLGNINGFNLFNSGEEGYNREKEPLKVIINNVFKKKINFRFRYAWIERDIINNKRYLFIIGERAEKSGIDFIERMTKGYEESHLRIWYCNIDDDTPVLKQIVYEYPLPISPKLVIYDGYRYIYFIWNRNNIWRLDFKGVLQNKNENHWYRLPPCINCDFLGDTNTDKILYGYILPPRYLVIVNNEGAIAKFDIEKFVWIIEKEYLQNNDKLINEDNNKVSAIPVYDKINNDLYFIRLGDLWGKYINLYYMQLDNFYFDLRYFKKTVEYLDKFMDKGLYPVNIKRSRLYTFNHLGHIYYSWIRIDGYFDLTYNLEEFYKTDEIRIYGDLTLLSQSDRVKVYVYELDSGWIELDSNSNVNKTVNIYEPDWIWESDYTRRYYRIVVLPSGEYSKATTKLPNNYIKYDLRNLQNRYISKIRVVIDPYPLDYNYTIHLNKVDSYVDTTDVFTVRTESDASPLEILHIQPLNVSQDESPTYICYIKNNSQNTIKNVYIYIKDNIDILLSKDGQNFDLYNEDNPLLLIDELPSGATVEFYFKVLNVIKQPIHRYLVVKYIT